MTQLSSSDLAKALNVSPGRVSQYVSGGKLDGCYTGDGRARRFDLEKVCTVLGRKLDQGQMMGNGAGTKATMQAILDRDEEPDEDDLPLPSPSKPAESSELSGRDPDRYALGKILKIEEEARRLRRLNAEAEGTFVLALEVRQQTARLIAQELAEVEAVMRDSARRVADRLGVDFKAVRQILIEDWRAHRAKRAGQLEGQARVAEMTTAEEAADI